MNMQPTPPPVETIHEARAEISTLWNRLRVTLRALDLACHDLNLVVTEIGDIRERFVEDSSVEEYIATAADHLEFSGLLKSGEEVDGQE